MQSKSQYRRFNLRLSRWYKKNKRPYPWRECHDLYLLLVAEILLQKTNADKVSHVYLEIIDRFPNAYGLAIAEDSILEDIIRPLGLISKAKNLKSMAKHLTTIEIGSRVTKEQLISFRGVGDYIAGAVLIHYSKVRTPLLDPNFIRILGRVFHFSSSLKRPRTDKKLWEKAKGVMPKTHVSEYVYAMLDFGALVCRLSKPKCHTCPMFNDVCQGP